jgi:hypothetical protein
VTGLGCWVRAFIIGQVMVTKSDAANLMPQITPWTQVIFFGTSQYLYR